MILRRTSYWYEYVRRYFAPILVGGSNGGRRGTVVVETHVETGVDQDTHCRPSHDVVCREILSLTFRGGIGCSGALIVDEVT